MDVASETPHRGFTLIELLVVIAIIGLLASVVMASLNSAREKARDAQRVSQMKQVQAALEIYYSSNGSYPTGTPVGPCLETGWQTPLAALVTAGYLSTIPLDPLNSSPYCYNYSGTTSSNSSWYCDGVRRSDYAYSLIFALEGETDAFPEITDGPAGLGATHCILGERVKF